MIHSVPYSILFSISEAIEITMVASRLSEDAHCH